MTPRVPEDAEIHAAFGDIRFDMPVSHIIRRAKRRQARRKMMLGAVPAAGLIAAGGVAILSADDLVPNNVICFDQASLDSTQYPIANNGKAPNHLCADLWADGTIEAGQGGTIPALQVCALSDGSVGVFPSKRKGFCESEGLQDMPEGYEVPVARFVEMRDDMRIGLRRAAVASGGSEAGACLSSSASVAVVSDVLHRHGFDDWTVVIGPDHEGPCRIRVTLESGKRRAVIYSTDAGLSEVSVF